MPKKSKEPKPIELPQAAENSEDSDEDAPVEVSGSLSRQDQASRLRDYLEASKKRAEAERERRRQRHEVFRIQKERKLRELENRKLPQDVLDAVSKKPSKSEESANNDVNVKNSLNQGDSDVSDGQDDLEMDKGFEDDLCSLDSFIPLESNGSNTVRVRSHHELLREATKAGNTALEFKTKHYYGRTIPRQTTKQRQLRVAKRRALQQGNKAIR